VPTPAFDPYPNSTAAAGATSVRVPANPDLSFPTDAVINAITPRTRMIFLNTPNNPTGQLISIADLMRISEAARDAIVLIDEAYIEFGGEELPAAAGTISERARRPYVFKGVRPGGHACRHRHRPAARAAAGA
jgi:histidinol-phosphate aminotransferase